MKKYLFLVLALISSNAFAAYTCVGKVSGIAIEPANGNVLVERLGPLVWSRLCSVEYEFNGVSTETCKTIYSTLLSAQMADKNVTLWFNDGKDCSSDSHTPWRTLTGWYFGPKLSN